jgi:hypothetical protein
MFEPKDGIFKIRHALASLYGAEAEYILRGDDYLGLEWKSVSVPKPTEQELLDEVQRLQNEFDSKQYKQLRADEYPPIGDQLDALFHAGVFPKEMADKIQAIKNKYPKT